MRDFFKNILATVVGLILFSAIGLGGLIFLVVSATLRETAPQVKDDSLLVLDLAVSIDDTEPTSTTGEALQRALEDEDARTLTLRDVVKAIDHAATNDRIVGLFIQGTPGEMTSGYANLVEVRAALQRFRDAGKPIIAHDRDWTEREYYLASTASELSIDPLGLVVIDGLSAESSFLAGAFDKYGIGVQVVRVGNYKSAVEPFTRQNYSQENREQLRGILADLWNHFANTVAPDRDLTGDRVREIANTQGLLLANEAVTAQLVDRVAYDDEIVTRLKEITNVTESDESFRRISTSRYIDITNPAENGDFANVGENEIAVIYAEGPIVDGEGGLRQIGGDRFARQLRSLRLDDDVKAVVLRVNSPGGSAVASEVIKREVELIREVKPVVVSMGNVAASGGYWISMAADEIVAQPNTVTGSIGVFGVFFNVQELGNENGVTWDVVKTSPFADFDTAARPKTQQELALAQKFVNTIYQRFIQQVSNWRELPLENVQQIAQGRVWSGFDASQNGLVDRLGGLETAIAAAAERAELGEDWTVREYPRVKSFEEQLIEDLFGVPDETVLPEPLAGLWEEMQSSLTDLSSYNDPRGAYTRLPFTLNID
ncbi:MAG: signal peptide peptidase SppA [Cyanobacteria bacterium SID2]|nr:signal peptide peptidase SppA [Cyanobacteria bacterium SID2]MBP0002309.1 signal peptide peptidase SppA [Cyanobacteria bacterium SBC]